MQEGDVVTCFALSPDDKVCYIHLIFQLRLFGAYENHSFLLLFHILNK